VIWPRSLRQVERHGVCVFFGRVATAVNAVAFSMAAGCGFDLRARYAEVPELSITHGIEFKYRNALQPIDRVDSPPPLQDGDDQPPPAEFFGQALRNCCRGPVFVHDHFQHLPTVA
jgi:hypothetical protein